MRRDDLYLADIVSAADSIASFLTGVTESRFVADDLVRSAVLLKLTIIGEAAARMSQPIRDKYTAVPWRDIIAFRNIAVHRYFGIDWHIVWNAATVEVPALRPQITSIIEDLKRGDNP